MNVYCEVAFKLIVILGMSQEEEEEDNEAERKGTRARDRVEVRTLRGDRDPK